MYIHVKDRVTDATDTIIRHGHATVINATYNAEKYQQNKKGNKQSARRVHNLGEIIRMEDADRTAGIFRSAQRGLKYCDLTTDTFSDVDPHDSGLLNTRFAYKEPAREVSFGRPYLFMTAMWDSAVIRALRAAAPGEEFFRCAMAHLTGDCLRNGENIKTGAFLKNNIFDHILTGLARSRLDCDSPFFFEMGLFQFREAFFRAFAGEMQKDCPNFGKSCCDDSTAAPGDAGNNPYNAICSHGTDGAVMQSRIHLLPDKVTGAPVRYTVLPATIPDKSTSEMLIQEVRDILDIEIDDLTADAGYCVRKLFETFNIDNNTCTDENGNVHDHSVPVKMANISGYPTLTLYTDSKPHFHDPDCEFDYEHHTFSGMRFEVSLFGCREYACVCVDRTQAASLLRRWRENNLDEWPAMDHNDKEWFCVRHGCFVLIGNRLMTPKEALINCRGRTDTEFFFRDGKTFPDILPPGKWTRERVPGKILPDIIETTACREFRRNVSAAHMSMSALLVAMNGWDCTVVGTTIKVHPVEKKVREIFAKLGYEAPGKVVDLIAFRREVLEGIHMDRTPAAAHRARQTAGRSNKPISPEAKTEAEERRREESRKKQDAAVEARARKAGQRAQDARDRAEREAQEIINLAEPEAQKIIAGEEAKAREAKTPKGARTIRRKAQERAGKIRARAARNARKARDKGEGQAQNHEQRAQKIRHPGQEAA